MFEYAVMKRQLFSMLAVLCLPLQISWAGQTHWEIGVGFTTVSVPDYIGSNDSRILAVPYPYIIYRSENFRFDRGEASRSLFNSERWLVDISLSGSFPTSDNNDARRDMPDLDAIGEIGPALKYIAYKSETERFRIELELPLRAAIATDIRSFEHVGWRSDLSLSFLHQQGPWSSVIRTGFMYSNDRFHNYIYGVEQQFVTGDRSFFDADSGYMGWQLQNILRYRRDRLRATLFLNYYNINNSKINNSSLVERKDSYTAGINIAWIFKTSS